MRNLICFFLILALLQGCIQKKDSKYNLSIPEYKIDFSGITNIENTKSPYLDRSFVPLETKQNALLGSVTKINSYNGNIYISDKQKIVEFKFDNDKKFAKIIKVLNNIGRGPGEYLSITDFTFDDKYIFLYDADNQKVNFYDINTWKFIKDIKLKFNALQMEKHKDYLVFFTLHLQNKKEYDYELITFNTSNNKEHKWFKNSNKQFGSPSGGRQFYKSGDNLFYCAPFRNITYKLNNNSEPEIFAIWNFKNKGVYDLNETMQSITQMESSDIYYNFNEPIVINKYIYIQFTYKGRYKCLWYNIDNKSLFFSNISSMPKTTFGKFFISTFPSWEISAIDKKRILNDSSALKMYSKVLNVKEDDNPCVLLEEIRHE